VLLFAGNINVINDNNTLLHDFL